MNRRRFLKGSIAASAAWGLDTFPSLFGDDSPSVNTAKRIKEHRTLGRTGFKVSDIAFGSAELSDASLLSAILDAGVNYVDSSEVYGNGGAERIIGSVITNRDRKSLFLTTKVKVRKADTRITLIDRAEKCLERLKTEYIDCLMYHGPSTVDDLKSPAFHGAISDMKSRGRVRYCGVSCHGGQWGDVPVPMDRILTAAAADGRFDVMVLVYNFLQREKGERVLEACRRHAVGATLMKTNPVLNYMERQEEADAAAEAGRELTEYRKATLQHLKERAERTEDFRKRYGLDDYDAVRSAAIRFVLNNPLVSCICTTIKNFSDLYFYTALSGRRFDAAADNRLAHYRSAMGRFYCRHACGECEPHCPSRVPVNTIMRYNHYFQAQGREKTAMGKYAALPTPKADTCRACTGNCEGACPYGIPIRKLLLSAHNRLTIS